ncbi:response regulator [Paenibacillus alginolyticus]|uniref:Response regulator n=1 Tax=Paenibacillus alginolyticus TaxID=59839 RepID=A0ABT4GKA3_9BACL|nr:response regulator [Paenibacillus alginolyticus]MCY9670185.1 response regulator [Paenibacillus alginolyticus]MCY9696613.1 response regulator [Paenibacillus alginolyticus]MEC0145224.1 response regulator [Paenibacillus alginolyticus]
MKICVVDDEKEVRLSIIYKIEMLFPYAQIFDVEFGRFALEKIQLVRPDLVFMDIRMPEMDGLEILRSVKNLNASIQVVILSGYDDFEYARKAMQLGAMDYLLKPADREQLREVITKVEQDMQIAFRKELEDYLGKLSSQYLFIHDIQCFNTSLWFDERQMKEIYVGDTTLLLERFKTTPQQILISFSINNEYSGVVVGAFSGENGLNFFEKGEFLSVLVSRIEQYEGQRYFGGQRESVVSTEKQRKEIAKQASQLRQEILSYAKAGNYEKLKISLHAWFDELQGLAFNQLRKECVNLMALLDEGLSKNEVVVLEEEKIHYWWNWVAEHKTWNELKIKIQKFILDGVNALRQLEIQSPSNLNWFEQALQLVDHSLDPNLSLESVAEVVGVHPVTLSRIFKQQTGMNFVRYIVRRRMRDAQSMLLKTDKKINEISEEIGYVDYRYFRTLFKKEFGLTPSEYRKRNGISAASDEGE